MADDLAPPDDLTGPPPDLAGAGPPHDLVAPPGDLTPAPDAALAPTQGWYMSGVSGAWNKLKADAAATLPSKPATGFWDRTKQMLGQDVSAAKLPLDVFSAGLAVTGIPQALGAVNEVAGEGVAKVLPSIPNTQFSDVGKSFSDMAGTAEQLAVPEKGGPIQTVLDRVSGGPPAPPGPSKGPAPAVEGTYRVVNPGAGPTDTLKQIAAGQPVGAEPAAQPDAAAQAAAPAVSPAPPADLIPAQHPKAPVPGSDIGLTFPNAPSRRATVGQYFDGGNAVRLHFDNGQVADYLTTDVLRDQTTPPPPMNEGLPPANTQQLSQEERAAQPLDDWTESAPRFGSQPRQPSQPTLGADALQALDQAHGLERTALDTRSNLSGVTRQDMLAEAARLRRLNGMDPSGQGDVGPNSYRPAPPNRVGSLPLGPGDAGYAHPLSAEPAADLGELAAARVNNPQLYQGEYAPAPPVTRGQTPDPAFNAALDDIAYARAPMPRGPSLFDEIRGLGGIAPDQGGDVAQIMQGFKGKPFQRRVVNPEGLSPDDMRSALQERGWFGTEDRFGSSALETGAYPGDDLRDLYDLMDREARGEPVYHPDSSMAQDTYDRRILDEELGRAGVGAGDPPQVAARKLADFRNSYDAELQAAEHNRSIDTEDLADLSPAGQERIEPHEYEPGTDFGAEHEAAGEVPAGFEGQEPFAEGPRDIAAGGDETIRSGEDAPENYAVEPQDLGRGSSADQTVIPGAERSAQQLAQAREDIGHGRIRSSAEQKAPGGLFDEPGEDQPGLFDVQQPDDSEAAGFPKYVTYLDGELADWLSRNGIVRTPMGLSRAIRDYLLQRGAKTGNEALALYDATLGDFSHVATQDLPGGVAFSDDMVGHLLDRNTRVIGHHNHPSARGLSGADIGSLAFPGMRAIVAHTPDGNWYGASLSPRWRQAVDGASGRGIDAVTQTRNHLMAIANRVRDGLATVLQKAIHDGQMTVDEADLALHHTMTAFLAHHGVLDYAASKELSPHVARIADEAARTLSRVPSYRSPEPVRYDAGIARILEANGEPVAGRSSGASGNNGDKGGTGEAGVEQPDDPRFEAARRRLPEDINEAGDHLDDTAAQMAGELKDAPPGTYARTLDRMAPQSGPEQFKDINFAQKLGTDPRVIASLDTPSAKFWNAWKARDITASSLLHEARDAIPTFLKQDEAARNRIYAVEELDRINNQVRTNDGRSIVTRNDGVDFARHSQPGDVVKLSPAETKAYFERRAMFQNIWGNIMKGTAKRLGWNGDWSPDMATNIKAIRDAAAKPSNRGSEIRSYQNMADIMQAMEEQRRSAYVPLMRHGDYFVSVTPKIGTDMESTGGFPKTAWFELVERPAFHDITGAKSVTGQTPDYAAKRIAELQQQFPAERFDMEHGWLHNKPGALRNLDIPAVEKLLTVMEGGVFDKLRQDEIGRGVPRSHASQAAQTKYDQMFGDMVNELRNQMYESMKAGFKKRSRTVPGYDGDFDRATGSYMHWTSGHVAEQMHGDEIERTYSAIQDNHPYKSIKDYWHDWKNYQDRPSDLMSRFGNQVQRAGFLYTMAGNPSSSAVILMHGPEMGIPVMSNGVGMGLASRHFGQAMKEVTGAIRGDTTKGLYIDTSLLGKTPAEKALIAAMDKEGWFHSSATDDMRALNDKQSTIWGKAKPLMRRALDMASSNISVADKANRISMALATHRMAMDPATLSKMDAAWRPGNQVWRTIADQHGVSPETMSRFMVSQGAGEWGRANRAWMMRGPGQMLFFLHGFQKRLLSSMWTLGKNSGPSGKVALAWMLGGLWAGAGLQGEPFVQDAQNAADWAWKQMTGHDPMLAYRLQSALAQMPWGKVGSEIAMHGPVSTLTGVDLADRIGLGDILTREMTDIDVMGTLPSILWNTFTGAQKRLASHQQAAAVAGALPVGLRNPAMAQVEAKHGIKSESGKTIYAKPQDISPADTAIRTLGFKPMSEERDYQRNDWNYRARKAHGPVPPDPIPTKQEGFAKGGRVHEAARAADRDPSQAQIEAGNYRKGHVSLHGFEFTIETPQGAARRGVGPDGRPWENRHATAHYGYLKKTTGADGEHVDAYIGPHHDSKRVFIVNQIDPKTKRFDEHKLIFGARSPGEARAIYDGGFSDNSGPKRRWALHETDPQALKAWLAGSKTHKPFPAELAAA